MSQDFGRATPQAHVQTEHRRIARYLVIIDAAGVGLARLFLSANRLLWVLDEPFTALDVHAVADLAATLSAHCDAGGMVMLTTHQDAPFARPPDVLDVGAFAC